MTFLSGDEETAREYLRGGRRRTPYEHIRALVALARVLAANLEGDELRRSGPDEYEEDQT